MECVPVLGTPYVAVKASALTRVSPEDVTSMPAPVFLWLRCPEKQFAAGLLGAWV